MIKWCKLCVLPDTRPNLKFNKNGICSACLNHTEKKKINWKNRRKTLLQLLKKVRRKKRSYDCIIPVSGGKDSTWQTIKCLELGLRPLAVTWKTPFRSEIGNNNLKNLISLGVDHIDLSINPKLEKKIMIKSLKEKGSTAILMHLAIFNIPRIVASKFDIPLIVWGENSAYEYADEKNIDRNSDLNNRWLKRFSATNRFNLDQMFSKNKNYLSYFLKNPSNVNNSKNNIRSIFLGHFYKWDPTEVNRFVKKRGFKNTKKPKTGFYNFADIDDESIITIHHWLKWYKFGFTRIFDNLSLEIRNGRMTRSKAISIIKKEKFNPPAKEIKRFCLYTGMSLNNFFSIIKKFRNKKIWKKNKKNEYYIKNFIIEDFWNENK